MLCRENREWIDVNDISRLSAIPLASCSTTLESNVGFSFTNPRYPVSNIFQNKYTNNVLCGHVIHLAYRDSRYISPEWLQDHGVIWVVIVLPNKFHKVLL